MKTEKTLTVLSAFHNKGSVPRLNIKRKVGVRGCFDYVKQQEFGL